MGADHAMALEVVTADGRFVTASSTSNSDLYWALRGGGGSTFGIVTSVIVRVHPQMPFTVSKFSFGTGGPANVSKEAFWQGLRAYLEQFIPFTDAGTYSYFWVFSNATSGSYSLEMTPFFAPNHTIESFNKLTKPLFDRWAALGIPVKPVTQQFDSFLPAFEVSWGRQSGSEDRVGTNVVLPGNRLFPRASWETKFDAIFNTLKKTSEAGRRWGGYHQAPRNRANVDNAVSSAFRNAVAFFISAAALPPNATPEQVKGTSTELTDRVLGPWREVVPDSEGGGAYLNEADVMEPNWKSSFYGDDKYPRLLKIKQKWDPEGVFYAYTGVGSEEWKVRDGEQGLQTQNGRLCRVS